MAKKYDIGVRKNQKKKKDEGFALGFKCFVSMGFALVSVIAFFYLLINKDTLLAEEIFDLAFFQIKFTPTIMICSFILVLLFVFICGYFSVLSLMEYRRRKNRPSDLEKQIELIEAQFTEREKKTYISSKEKMRQLEESERKHKENLERKYGDNK